jgi:hypothetical protein
LRNADIRPSIYLLHAFFEFISIGNELLFSIFKY